MKKVRLFAVAAAMGMFASTVSAADYVTKDAYVATWGNVDEIIKVDVGDKVVAPIANISVVKETRTTDPKYATASGSLGLEDNNTCFEGFTNTVGKDSNEDGYVDAPILTADINNLTGQNWLHTDAKFFPTAKTATYYVGLGNGEATGGRFLAPGAAKKDVYALALKHQHLADDEAVLKYFEEQNILSFSYDEDGYIEYVDINPITVKDEKGKVSGTASTRITTEGHRYSDDEIKEAIIKMLVDGSNEVDLETDYYTISNVYTKNYTQKTPLKYFVGDDEISEEEIKAGYILKVEENRYGDLEISKATDSDLKMANGKPLEAVEGKIIIALSNEDKDNTWSKYMTITPAEAAAYTQTATMVWDEEAGNFVKKYDDAQKYTNGALTGIFPTSDTDDDGHKISTALEDKHLTIPAHTLGLYHLETPANTSDKIVIYTEDLDLKITGLNTKKETMTIGYGDDKELTVTAVKLDGKWYPAVNNESELTKFVEKVLDLKTLNDDDFEDWAEAYEDAINNPLTGVTIATRTNAKGEKEEYIPENSLQHYKGTFCTYSVSGGTKVDPTITSNADSIDTSTSGVKNLTLTAKVGDEVVGTKDVKVVVAPKYQREYKNGKVVKLTAFYLDGKTPYAIYNYDWAKKTYTATFYNQDGITVAATANGTL